jgi:hypothetical protein
MTRRFSHDSELIIDGDLAMLCALSIPESPSLSEEEKCDGPFNHDTKHSALVPTVAECTHDTANVFVNPGQCGPAGAGLAFWIRSMTNVDLVDSFMSV